MSKRNYWWNDTKLQRVEFFLAEKKIISLVNNTAKEKESIDCSPFLFVLTDSLA